MKSNITLCLVLVLNCFNTISQKSSETCKLRIPLMESNFLITELDGKAIDNPGNNPQRVFMINEGIHKALLTFYASYNFVLFNNIGLKSTSKSLEFTTEKDKEYILKGLIVNTYDTINKAITINDNRYADVIEKKSGKRVGGIIETGILYFSTTNDPSNYSHLYYDEKISGEDAGIHSTLIDYDRLAIVGRSNDGILLKYYFNESNKSISKSDLKFKQGIYNIYFEWGMSGISQQISGISYSFKAESKQMILNSSKDLLSSSESFIVLKTSELTDIFFLDDGLHGWIVGNDGIILKTTDGGIKWSYMNIKSYKRGSFWMEFAKSLTHSNLACSFNKVYFIDSLSGWITGNNGLILHTSNGGIDWTIQKSGSKLDVKDIYFKNASEGIISQQSYNGFPVIGCIMHTKDSGNSWVSIDQSKVHPPYHYLVNLNNLWKYEFNALHFSDNLGATWQVRMGPNKAFNMTQIKNFAFIDENNIWAISNGLLYYTNDKGINWEQKTSQNLYINKLLFIDLNDGYAIEPDGNIIKTIDSGKPWNNYRINAPEYITDLEFKQKTGWAVGNMGGIYKSDDGGINWRYQNVLDFVE